MNGDRKMCGRENHDHRASREPRHRPALSLFLSLLILASLLLISTTEVSSAGHTWIITVVDSSFPGIGCYSSIKVDSLDRSHISYKADSLKHAYWNGTAWLTESVDSSMQPWTETSIALDSLDRPHISYHDRDAQDLRYAYWNGSGWKIEVVDSIGDVGEENSLDLDSMDRPHIVYGFFRDSKWQIRYAHWNGSSWNFHDLNYTNEVAYPHIAIGPLNTPYMSFYDLDVGDLMLAKWNGSDWLIELVDGDGNSGLDHSLALDSLGYPHIAYHVNMYPTISDSQLRYASWNGTEWIIETAWAGGQDGLVPVSLDLNSREEPGIAYARPQLPQLLYLWKAAGRWYNETVYSGNYVHDVSLAFDGIDLPHVSYCTVSSDTYLFHATFATPPLPDLTISEGDIGLDPPSPIVSGTSVNITANVHNEGIVGASGVLARYYDGRPPSGLQIGGDADLGTIDPLGSALSSIQWTAGPPGLHEICAVADPDDVVAESNETNNMACLSVLVQSPPIKKPDYAPFLPLPQPPIKAGFSRPVSLSVVVHNQGNATASDESTLAFYNESTPAIPFAAFKVSPVSTGGNSSRFIAIWTSSAVPGTYLVSADVDHESNVTEWDETNNVYTWTIDVVSGPVTSLAVGSPSHTSPASVMYAGSSTPLDLSVIDQSGTGINHTRYRIDNITWTEYSSSFFLSGDGDHYVEWYSEDNVGNVEVVSWRVLRVDDTPPATAISIGEPKYLTGGNFVKSSTPLALSVVDGGVGSNSTFYRLWGDSWSQWRDYSSPFSLTGRDGTWFVEFLSFDHLGNMETIQNETLILDDTPPVTTISPVAPFTLTTADSGCGVNVTMYRMDGGSWIIYTGGFTLMEGEHTIYYYSIDKLGNIEQEKSLVVKPPTEVAVNYKPIVALVFVVILLMAGVWSSKRKPWRGGRDRMAVAKAFMLTSVPFMLAEAATGMVSLLTGQLSTPPLVGAGTAVDLAILLAGMVVAILRIVRTKPSGAGEAGTPQKR